MKNLFAILTCSALLTSLAFAQTGSKGTSKATSNTEAITVTGTIIKMTTGEGSAANYQPFKTLVVREDHSKRPGTYVLEGAGHVVNRKGELVQTAIKPGTRVQVYFVDTGNSRVIDHVVVD